MSLKLGTQDIAGISTHTNVNAHSLFDFKWSDHLLDDISWLRADTFSWQSGDVYTSAYNHLVQDIQGITAETETIGSYTVTFYRATDGHKVALADQETTIANIYNETGIAWYYILDTTNTQFKLPRTKYGFEGLRTNVGDNINESLPNITGYLEGSCLGELGYIEGAFKSSVAYSGNPFATTSTSDFKRGGLNFKASDSNATYQDNAPVQERATQMYLYFYVGDYTQSAIEQTAGLNSELFNGKVDLNASNLSSQGMSYIAGLGMPSNKYIDLTVNASNASYIAPANGYFAFDSWVTGNWISLSNGYIRALASKGSDTGIDISGYIPVTKGQTVTLGYDGTWQPRSWQSHPFCFVYAQGSESEAS